MTRSEMMSRIRSVSKIEKLPKQMSGMYLRKHPTIYGKPDFGNKSRKIAVFIDGCFWHICPIHFRMPKTNRKFWIKKFKYNAERDKMVNNTLELLDYNVIRIWEHDIKK